MTINYLPTVGLFIAVEPRSIPYEWPVAADGLFPGVKKAYGKNPEIPMPAVKLEKGRLPVNHVLAVASTHDECERLGNMRRTAKLSDGLGRKQPVA